MKKSMVALLMVAVIVIAAVPFVLKWTAGERSLETVTTSNTLASGNPTGPVSTNGAGTVYVRTNGGLDLEFPQTKVIRSVEELNVYYEENKDVFNLERTEDGDGFLDACEAFDASYFARRILVLLVLQEGSGSIRHEVKAVRLTAEKRLEIDIEAVTPNGCTCDMAQWHLFIQPAPGIRAEDIREIKINRMDRTTPSRTGNESDPENLMRYVTVNDVKLPDRGINGRAVTPFAVRLLQHSAKENENTLLSPLSVLSALAMTANGADGNTKKQLETAFGMTVEEINEYLLLYRRTLLNDKSTPTLSPANAIWFQNDERLTVQPSFLQANADYFGATMYKAPFNKRTVGDINRWVRDNTNQMILELIDELPQDTVMCLLNALAFDAEWEKPYEERQVREGSFTAADGTVCQADMMYSGEREFLNDGKATGFVKYYRDRKYAFAALLPNETVSITDYVASLTGDGLYNTLSSAKTMQVHTAMPKFDTEYQTELSDVLREMGVTDAFDENTADFSKLGSFAGGNLYIGRVVHKTRMSVNELGTKAGAATAVLMDAGSAIVEYREVILDRPFVYVLFDCETKLPIFLGVMNNIQ